MARILLEPNEAAYGSERTILILGNGVCMLQQISNGDGPHKSPPTDPCTLKVGVLLTP